MEESRNNAGGLTLFSGTYHVVSSDMSDKNLYSTISLHLTLLGILLATFRSDYEYEIEYVYDFRISKYIADQ